MRYLIYLALLTLINCGKEDQNDCTGECNRPSEIQTSKESSEMVEQEGAKQSEYQDSSECISARADYLELKRATFDSAIGANIHQVDSAMLTYDDGVERIGFCVYRPGIIYHTIIPERGGPECGAIVMKHTDNLVISIEVVDIQGLVQLMNQTIQNN